MLKKTRFKTTQPHYATFSYTEREIQIIIRGSLSARMEKMLNMLRIYLSDESDGGWRAARSLYCNTFMQVVYVIVSLYDLFSLNIDLMSFLY